MTEDRSKRALVVGGTGLLGSGVAAELVEAGWNTTLLSRGGRPVPPELGGCEHRIASREDVEALRGALGKRAFDIVVDCAAYTRQDVEGAMAAFADKAGHYFFISTDFVYAADPAAVYPLAEDARVQYGLAYAQNKLAAEAALAELWEAPPFPYTILRPPHILGAGKPLGCDPVAGGRDQALISRLREGEPIPLLAEGSLLIQPVWSREVGRCVLALAGQRRAYSKILNCAGGQAVATRRYYEIVAEALGVSATFRTVDLDAFVERHPEKAHLARHRIYDLSRLRECGFIAKLSLRDAIQETLAWQDAQPGTIAGTANPSPIRTSGSASS